MRANVYFVRSGLSWALVDAGSAKCAPAIQKAAESLFGKDVAPASILLTHDHPIMRAPRANGNHDVGPYRLGASRRNADGSRRHRHVPRVRESARPLDRTTVDAPHGVKTGRGEVAKASLKEVARPFDPGAELPVFRTGRPSSPRPHPRACSLLPQERPGC